MGETKGWEQMKDNQNKGHLRKLTKEQLKRMITTLNRESYWESAATVKFSGFNRKSTKTVSYIAIESYWIFFWNQTMSPATETVQPWQGRRCWMLFIWSFEIMACHKLACFRLSVRKDWAKEHAGSKKRERNETSVGVTPTASVSKQFLSSRPTESLDLEGTG